MERQAGHSPFSCPGSELKDTLASFQPLGWFRLICSKAEGHLLSPGLASPGLPLGGHHTPGQAAAPQKGLHKGPPQPGRVGVEPTMHPPSWGLRVAGLEAGATRVHCPCRWPSPRGHLTTVRGGGALSWQLAPASLTSGQWW